MAVLNDIRVKLIDIIKLSGPVIVSRVGLLSMSLVDTLMVGNFSTTGLAALSLAHAISTTLMVIGVGMLIGILVIASTSVGEGKPDQAGIAWQRGTCFAGLLGLLFLALSVPIGPTVQSLGVSPDIAAQTGHLAIILGVSLMPILLFVACTFFLEGIGRVKPGMYAMLAANLLNIVLNYGLVYGEIGLPGLGAEGSAWATLIVRVFLAVGVLIYILFIMAERSKYGVSNWAGWKWSEWKVQRHIGYGGGLSFGIEAGAFMALAIVASQLGPEILAGNAILINIRSLIFMLAMGVGFATSVQVGMAHGRGSGDDIRLSTWVGFGLGMAAMAVSGIVIFFVPQELIGAYTNDPNIVAIAAPMIVFLAIALPLDGGQGVMANALRGWHDAWTPTLCHIIAYLVVMVPLGWFLSIKLGHSIGGLMEAIIIGNLVAVTLLAARFQWKVKCQLN